MKKQWLSPIFGLLIVAVTTSCSMTTARADRTMIKLDQSTLIARETLQLRFVAIHIAEPNMIKALLRISDAIDQQSGGKRHFTFLVEDAKRPSPTKENRDRPVTFNAEDISLASVLSDLCRQSGWHYSKAPFGYVFQEG